MQKQQGLILPAELAGPEQLTLVERFVSQLRLPYLPASVALAIVMGFPGLLLSYFLESWNLNLALDQVLITYPTSALTRIVDIAVSSLIVFYMLYLIRYMRTRVTSVEPRLVDLTPGGESTLHRIFGHVSSMKAQLLCAFLLLVADQAVTALSPSKDIQPVTSPLSIILSLGIGALFYLTAGTFAWVYASSLWGLHRFGKQNLRLQSYQEDRLLGGGPVGSLSFGLAKSYYTVVGLLAFEWLLAPDETGSAILTVLVALGGVMFVLPLRSIHQRMVEEKGRSEEELRLRMAEFSSSIAVPTVDNAMEPNGSVAKKLDHLLQLQLLQHMEKRLGEVPTWPYDRKMLETFTAIFISLLVALMARVLIDQLRL